jgi:ATP-dependent DNA helicase RecG
MLNLMDKPAKELQELLKTLIAGWEHETVEFKQGGKGYSTDDIGKYFSALSNEANLRGMDHAYLIFGVHDKNKKVIGTDYRNESKTKLQGLKHQVAQDISTHTTFSNIYEFEANKKRVLIFEIPPAPLGQPIAWKGFWYCRAGESIAPLDLSKLDKIRNQQNVKDWSSEVVKGSSIKDLDVGALKKAKKMFSARVNANNKKNILKLSDLEFLNKLELITEKGTLKRATILLLGKPESSYLLSPNPCQISWILKEEKKAYEHFSLPFLLNTTEVANRIRYTKIRLLPKDSLLPEEIDTYLPDSILEAIHNAVAHQDYTLNGRINVVEYKDKIVIENAGDFFEGIPIDYAIGNKQPKYYRNPLLVKAMVNLKMIDTIGSGIQTIYESQANRYLPMPDYDFSEKHSVALSIYGAPKNNTYTQILLEDKELSLQEIVTLDTIAKKKEVVTNNTKSLRAKGYVKGYKPNYLLNIGNIKDESTNVENLIYDFIKKSGSADRATLNKNFAPLLTDIVTEKQRIRKIGNVLAKLKKNGDIDKTGTTKDASWTIIS